MKNDFKNLDFIISGSDVDNFGIRYEKIWEDAPPPHDNRENAYRLISGDFVTTDEGTGIVHTAPTFGADDALAASQANPPVPPLLTKDKNGELLEPYESLSIDIEEEHQGAVMEALGVRKAELVDMISDGNGRVRLEYLVPARGLLGFQSDFLSMTRGTGLLSHVFFFF